MIFNNIYPSIDLHGEDRISAIIKTREFINDSIKLKKYTIVIVHGKGTGILKDAVHKELKKNKNVLDFSLDINLGSTIVNLKKDK